MSDLTVWADPSPSPPPSTATARLRSLPRMLVVASVAGAAGLVCTSVGLMFPLLTRNFRSMVVGTTSLLSGEDSLAGTTVVVTVVALVFALVAEGRWQLAARATGVAVGLLGLVSLVAIIPSLARSQDNLTNSGYPGETYHIAIGLPLAIAGLALLTAACALAHRPTARGSLPASGMSVHEETPAELADTAAHDSV